MKGESILMFLAGALAGGAAALLFAPEKGSVTRDKLKGLLEKELDDKLCHCDRRAAKEGVLDE